MNRSVFVFALVAATVPALFAQQASQNPYQGTSSPPPDETIITDSPELVQAKPAAGHPLVAPGRLGGAAKAGRDGTCDDIDDEQCAGDRFRQWNCAGRVAVRSDDRAGIE
jgi:hypothetical protein